MPPGVAALFRLLGQGLSLAVLRRPRSAFVLAGFGTFLAAWALGVLAYLALDALFTPAPRQFDAGAVWVHAGFGLGVLGSAWLAARALRRPAAWLVLATWIAVVTAAWMVVYVLGTYWFVGELLEWATGQRDVQRWIALFVPLAIVALLGVALLRTLWEFGQDASMIRRALAFAVSSLLLGLAWEPRDQAWFFYEDEAAAEVADARDDAPPASAHAASHRVATTPESRAQQRAADPEVLLGRQPAMVASALAALAPQAPGHVDLYALGFAGDGNEPTFRNEVEYFGQLMPARFGAQGHTVQLINHPGTTARTPLATLANLRATLAGIGARIDPEEDVVLVFLTSHGSPDHYLAIDQPPLPLRQVHPGDLRDALDDAGIRWRVVVVSACYSGGFVDALKDPRTLVITAARADRPSFGCGADSEITWFGRAFLTEALNQTTDFREAYAIAARTVRTRERENDELPSQPQIWAGDRIDAKLASLRAALPAAAAVPFVPAVPVDGDEP